MARSGDYLEMPDGSAFVVRKSASDTAGESVELIVTISPGTFSAPPHVHPRSADHIEVLDGELEVMLEESWRTVTAGDSVSVPAGTLHTVRNRSTAPVKLRVTHRPAVRFDAFLEHMHALARARGIRSPRDPRARILFAMLMLDYPDTLAPARARERVGVRLLAAIGRALRFTTAV